MVHSNRSFALRCRKRVSAAILVNSTWRMIRIIARRGRGQLLGMPLCEALDSFERGWRRPIALRFTARILPMPLHESVAVECLKLTCRLSTGLRLSIYNIDRKCHIGAISLVLARIPFDSTSFCPCYHAADYQCEATPGYGGNLFDHVIDTSPSSSIYNYLLLRKPLALICILYVSFVTTQLRCLDYSSIHVPGVQTMDHPSHPNQRNLFHKWQRDLRAQSHAFHKLVNGVSCPKHGKSQRVISNGPSLLFGQPMLR